MPSRTCVGCRVSLTNQIITFSRRWLPRKFITPKVIYKHYHHDEIKDEDELVRSHDLVSLAIKNVCIRCNNGWMSRLEARAKPTFLGLINMEISLSQLNAETLHRGSSSIKARD